jgi:hypothetical protein
MFLETRDLEGIEHFHRYILRAAWLCALFIVYGVKRITQIES